MADLKVLYVGFVFSPRDRYLYAVAVSTDQTKAVIKTMERAILFGECIQHVFTLRKFWYEDIGLRLDVCAFFEKHGIEPDEAGAMYKEFVTKTNDALVSFMTGAVHGAIAKTLGGKDEGR